MQSLSAVPLLLVGASTEEARVSRHESSARPHIRPVFKPNTALNISFSPVFAALASFVMVFGKLLFGFILGNIASTLANAEIRRVKYEEKLGAIQVCHLSF